MYISCPGNVTVKFINSSEKKVAGENGLVQMKSPF